MLAAHFTPGPKQVVENEETGEPEVTGVQFILADNQKIADMKASSQRFTVLADFLKKATQKGKHGLTLMLHHST